MLKKNKKKSIDSYNFSKKGSRKKLNIKPFHIHLSLILVLILGGFFYFSDGFGFNLNWLDSSDTQVVSLNGDLGFFNEPYSGSVKLYASDFVLEMEDGRFDISSTDVEMSDFVGRIYLMNETLVLDGTVDKIEYGNNLLRLNGKPIVLRSLKKVYVDFEFDKLILDFKQGDIKFKDKFSFDFVNTTITLQDFDCEFYYDGSFSFVGSASSFNVYSFNPNLNISYSNLK